MLMLEIILLSIAFIGSLAAGLWDLKTTEIPDEIPALMAVFGIFIWFVSDIWMLALSLAFGLAFLALGWLLYKGGQWGGGDAKLLSAVGFLLPTLGSQLFALSFISNIFIVGIGYMVVYSIALGALNRGTFSAFAKNIRKDYAAIGAIVAAAILLPVMLATGFYSEFPAMAWTVALLLFLVLFWKYSKTVEEKIFKKRIPASRLRVGDVLLESREWDGITEQDIARIKKSGKRFVTIKEGVRFGLVFPITLVVTYLFGNLILLWVGL